MSFSKKNCEKISRYIEKLDHGLSAVPAHHISIILKAPAMSVSVLSSPLVFQISEKRKDISRIQVDFIKLGGTRTLKLPVRNQDLKSGRRDSFSIESSTLSCMKEGTRFLDLSLVRMVNE